MTPEEKQTWEVLSSSAEEIKTREMFQQLKAMFDKYDLTTSIDHYTNNIKVILRDEHINE